LKKDLIIVICGRAIQILLSLISIRLITTFFNPKEVGNYYLALSILSFFNLAFLNPIGTYFSRNLLIWQKSKNILNAWVVYFVFMIFVAIISVPIVFILFELTDYSQKFSKELFLIYIILSLIISTSHRSIINGLNILGKRILFTTLLLSTLVIGLLSSILFICFIEESPLLWLFGIITSEIIILGYSAKLFFKKNKFTLHTIKNVFSFGLLKKVLLFVVPISFSTLLMWGQNISYRFIVDFKYSAEILGYIAVGLGVSSAIFSSIETLINQYFNPIFLKNILDANKEQRANIWNKIARVVFPIYIITLIFAISSSDKLITILASKEFFESYKYAMIGGFIEFFRVSTNLFKNVSQSEFKTKNIIFPYMLGFLISTIILILFDFKDNLILIPLVLAVAYLSNSVTMYFQMKKILSINLKIDYLNILFLSIPFVILFLLKPNFSLIYNSVVLAIFGVYYLWCLKFFFSYERF
jgi:O-antigen/teichoic acid export membrane protein